MLHYECDTFSYTHHSAIRTAGYPLLIDLFRSVFGNSWEICLSAFQILFALAAIAALIKTAARRFGLSRWAQAAGFIVLLFPLISEQSAIAILPEAVSYSLLLLCARELLVLADKGTTAFLRLGILAILNIFFRPQTAFVIPLIIIIEAIYLLRDRKLMAKAIGAILLLLPLSLLLELAYQKHFNGVFSKAKLTGIHMATNALYISEPGDLRLFEGTPYYDAMKNIYAEMDAKGLFARDRWMFSLNAREWNRKNMISPFARPTSLAEHNRQAFNETAWYTIVPNLYKNATGTDYMETKAYSDGKAWETIDRDGMDIFKRIARERPGKFLKLLAGKFTEETGFFTGILLVLILLAPLYYPCAASSFAAMMSAAALLNMIMVVCFGVVALRHMMPTYAPLVFSIVALADRRIRELCRENQSRT